VHKQLGEKMNAAHDKTDSRERPKIVTAVVEKQGQKKRFCVFSTENFVQFSKHE